ncbi:hypothetical protein XELAEV_18007232mg [Xenopus laevis]|uniref:Ig-like domain-containing protein n=1 Tax=Xenopus laevis TaxID=8355 RepID=A0A974E2I3_XENLA|nr:hypothetical protein XELAEV_18007232mg [Xenopus laevis]
MGGSLSSTLTKLHSLCCRDQNISSVSHLSMPLWYNIHICLYFLFLTSYFQGVQCNIEVFQTPLMIAEEGQDITLRCNHSVRSYDFLAWYKQLPGSSLEICASGLLQGSNICRVTMSIDKESLSTQLSISGVQVEESALYYCAVSDTMTETHNTAVPKVTPNPLQCLKHKTLYALCSLHIYSSEVR